METTPVKKEVQTIKGLFSQESVKAKFTELLGKRAPQFITSVLQIAASNDLLAKAEPASFYNAAATAATMDLPINQNLGFAYIVPYNDKKANRCLAQFQMGWRGFVQLAQRSGQFKTINAVEIYENQIDEIDYITGDIKLKKEEPRGKVIGYLAYFKLLNGFEKSFYMNHEQMKAHATKYSQSYKRGYGVWADGEDGFNAMGKKTVLKLLLQRFAPLSIEMQRAVITDQAIIQDTETQEVVYVDNCQTVEITHEELSALYELKESTLTKEELRDAKRILENKEENSYTKLFNTLQTK